MVRADSPARPTNRRTAIPFTQPNPGMLLFRTIRINGPDLLSVSLDGQKLLVDKRVELVHARRRFHLP